MSRGLYTMVIFFLGSVTGSGLTITILGWMGYFE